MDKVLIDIEELKDKNREMNYNKRELKHNDRGCCRITYVW